MGGLVVRIRTFERGDDNALVAIYNEAAGDLPKFKPATLDEIRRRLRGADFDGAARFFAVDNGRTVGYATYHANGRVSYPWCRKGCEAAAEPLFEAVLQAMQARGLRTAFAAYRRDWPAPRDFFLAHGFQQAREMLNFIVDLLDMPTPAARTASAISPLKPEDLPAVLAMAPQALRSTTPEELRQHLLNNPYFPPESLFVLRSRTGDTPLAVGVLVTQADYVDPNKLDADMPCFRLGAFGSEGMQVKRVNGLFSFLTAPGPNVNMLGLDLMAEAAHRLQTTEVETLAAQVPSDAPHLVRFYQQFYRRQGSFPVFERRL
jgi:hypothetical protein